MGPLRFVIQIRSRDHLGDAAPSSVIPGLSPSSVPRGCCSDPWVLCGLPGGFACRWWSGGVIHDVSILRSG